jgi:hypothetical protein
MGRFFLLFLCFLYVGCGSAFHYEYTHLATTSQAPYKHIPVYVDIQFGEADKIGIENALNTWNYVFNGYIKLDVISFKFDMEPSELMKALNEHGIIILKVSNNASFIPAITNGKVVAFCDNQGGNVIHIVRDNLPTEQIEFTTLHELGHILGAPDADGAILMNKNYSPRYSLCVDKRSMEYVAAYQHLDPTKLNYCIYE